MKNIHQRRMEKYQVRLARNERKYRRLLREETFRMSLGLPKGMPPESLDVIAQCQAMAHTKKPPVLPNAS